VKYRLLLLLLGAGLLTTTACRRPAEMDAGVGKLEGRVLIGPASSPLWKESILSIEDTMKAHCGIRIREEHWTNEAELAAALRRSGSEGIALIVCTGSNHDHAVELAAARYPRTLFLLENTRLSATNIRRLSFEMKEAAYLAGVAAAIIGQDRIGLIQACGGPWLQTVESGFRNGFKSQQHRTRIEEYPSLASLAAAPPPRPRLALYSCDHFDLPTRLHAREAGLLLFTIESGATYRPGAPVAGAIVIDLPGALRRIGEDLQSGTASTEDYDFDLGSGVVDFRVAPDIPGLNTEEALRTLDEARAAITAGVVEIEEMGL